MIPETGAPIHGRVRIRILQEVAVSPCCTVNQVISRLCPAYEESAVRIGVRQLLSLGHLDFDWGKSPPGIHLVVTQEGRRTLTSTGVPVPFVPANGPGSGITTSLKTGKDDWGWNAG